MQLFHFYHHHYRLRDLIPSDFWLFEFAVWLHVLARSVITIFIPILLLETGFSLQAVIIFYLLFHALDVPLNFAVGWLIERIGARLVMFFSNIFLIFFFIGLDMIEPGQYWYLGYLALLVALYDTFYWVAHLFLFMKSDRDARKAGSETGAFYSIKKIATMLGPILGAGLLMFVSQTSLVAVASALLLGSAIPLIYVTDFHDKPDITRTRRYHLRDFFRNTVDRTNLISTGLFSVHRRAELVLWPLFLYTIFGTIQSVAIVPVIVAATTIIFSVFNSRINASTRELMIMVGAALIAAVWLMRLYIDATSFYYISVAAVSIFSLLVMLPLDSNVFVRGRRTDPLSASVLRNTFSMTFPLLFLLTPLAVAVSIFDAAFSIVAAVMVLLILLNAYFMTTHKQDFDSVVG